MKTVLLLRHAKSSWDHPALTDHDRPLAPRGRKAAPRMGRYMAEEGLIPERILCSGAQRAMETLELASAKWDQRFAVEIRDEIYHGSIKTLLKLIHALPPRESSVLLIGHNPTFEDLAQRLAGSGDNDALQKLDRKYPTGALAVLDLDIADWGETAGGLAHLRAFVRPKDLA